MKNNKNYNSHDKKSDVQKCGTQGRVYDAPSSHWVYRCLPRLLWPYSQLARWDRPIGWQLLMWPCWCALFMALLSDHGLFAIGSASTFLLAIWYLLLFFVGAVAMRGAGCTWNDLVDHKIDAMVARTRSRPLPAQQLTRKQAKIFMVVQCLVGLVVLLQFNGFSIALGIASLAIVAFYPFMKRWTDWPQLYLGFVFNWGALMGWSAHFGTLNLPSLLFYAGAVLWTVGYDTIYAHQDKEDDALIGVRSTARLFGSYTLWAIVICYGGFSVLTGMAFVCAGVPGFAFLGLAAAAGHMLMQMVRLDIDNPDQCLKLFKSNTTVGLCIFAGLAASVLWRLV